MARIQVLTEQEEKKFNEPPLFLLQDRKYYFHINESLLNKLYEKVQIKNLCYMILQYGYLRARNSFFTNFYEEDIEYVKSEFLLEEFNQDIPKTTKMRYHLLLRDYCGIKETTQIEISLLKQKAIQMANTFQDRRKIFWELVNESRNLKIEVPSYTMLIEIISEAINIQKSSILEKLSNFGSNESLKKLDIFLDKDDKFKNKYQIGSFRRLEHGTAQKKIRKSLSHFQTIKTIFVLNKNIIDSVGITSKIAQYYAIWINKSRSSQLLQQEELDNKFYLLCFVYYQYLIRNDNLIDRFISVIQSSKTSLLREHKEFVYENVEEKNKTIQSYKDLILQILDDIDNCADNSTLDAINRIHQIKQYIYEQRELLNQKANESSIVNENKSKFDLIELKSRSLQGQLSGIVKAIEFDEKTSDKSIIKAINYFKQSNNFQNAPQDFLEDEEKIILINEDEFRTSLYKALLFYHISNHIKNGTLNLKYSYRYKSFEKYLIDKETWDTDKNELLKEHNLLDLISFDNFITPISKKLDNSYYQTNMNIIKDINTNFKKTSSAFTLKTPSLEKFEEDDSINKYLPINNFISVIEILNTINKHINFLNAFSHYNIKSTTKASEHSLLASILGYGCNISLLQMGKISKGIQANHLDTVKTWYFTEDNTLEANDKIVNFMNNLEIVKLLRANKDLNHTSSDGQKYNMKPSVESTNAGYSFKYFGTQKGVSVYTFIDESHRLFYSTVIHVNERESGYVIDGLLHNDELQSDIHSTDTHGFSEVIFGLTHLLGFSFAPRIKNFKDQYLYSIKPRKEYIEKKYFLVPRQKINIENIENNWDSILRFLVTIKSKKTSTSQLLKRLTSYSKEHQLYTAIKEFGKIIKTDFLLNYIDDVELRQRIEKQLNKVESSNKFSKAVFFGRNAEFTVATIEEQNIANNCKRLIQNSIILWNYLYLTQKIDETKNQEEKDEIIKTIQQSSIIHWSHINFYGEYDFTKLDRKDTKYIKDIDYTQLKF